MLPILLKPPILLLTPAFSFFTIYFNRYNRGDCSDGPHRRTRVEGGLTAWMHQWRFPILSDRDVAPSVLLFILDHRCSGLSQTGSLRRGEVLFARDAGLFHYWEDVRCTAWS